MRAQGPAQGGSGKWRMNVVSFLGEKGPEGRGQKCQLGGVVPVACHQPVFPVIAGDSAWPPGIPI